ncbi:unnamed protein product [Arctogadus glacialis]
MKRVDVVILWKNACTLKGSCKAGCETGTEPIRSTLFPYLFSFQTDWLSMANNAGPNSHCNKTTATACRPTALHIMGTSTGTPR